MALGLALLSHGSAAFAFPAIVALCCLPGVRPRLPVAALASVAFIIVLTPWAEYQTFFDPPGDRLLKLHLAGVNSLSDRRTTLQAVIDQYEALGFQGAVDNKRANLLTLAPPGMPGIADILPVSNAEAASSALTQHFYVAASLGLLNAGWFCLPFLLFRTDVATREVRSGVLVLLALVVATLLFWVLAMFGPGTAYTVLGSYTPELVLDFILACSIVSVRPVIAGLVYALVAMSFVDTYVVQTAGLPSQGFSAFATIVAAVGLVALVAMWRRIRILAAQAVRRQGATTTSILRGETI